MKHLVSIIILLPFLGLYFCSPVATYKKSLNESVGKPDCQPDQSDKYYLCTVVDSKGHLVITVYSKTLNKEIVRKATGSIGSASWAEGKILVSLLPALPQVNQTTYDYYLDLDNGDLIPLKKENHESH
ncbi:hypothetical protein [Ekhidna sp.]|uniref:hypothetical protein n=1 Tax=Ekhidna sp. TaxID=2608089 RepID=UPI003516EEF8